MTTDPKTTMTQPTPISVAQKLRKGIALIWASNYPHHRRPLAGALHDAERMSACLPPGFEIRRSLGPQLIRATLLRQLREVLEDAEPGEIVIVFFSGHGGICYFRRPDGRVSEQPHRYLVTEDEAVLDVEVSVLVAKLAERGVMVLWISDCCYAQGIVRSGLPSAALEQDEDDDERDSLATTGRVIKRVPPRVRDWPTHYGADYPEYSSFAGWLAAQREQGVLDPHGHPLVVRISASSAEQPAYEGRDEDGVPGGLLTIELCPLLAEHDKRRSVGRIMALLRARLAAGNHAALQRPEAEGPADRL
ncbi:MAG: caspase family protein, partial [Deltaproteobacteria bacterium]|nr:caspase family protein [Deltaproteobacteria bacterium]